MTTGMPGPLVTIVTPSLNQGRFLGETIASVLGQDYPHVEYLVQDGGSTDESAAVAAAFGDRLTWISERDTGQSNAINRAVRRARGELVGWVNADDVLHPNAITRMVEAAVRRPDAGLYFGDGELIDENGSLLQRVAVPWPLRLWELVHHAFPLVQPAAFFRRELFERLGGLRESLGYTMDWDLVIRLAKLAPFEYVPAVLARQRIHGATKTATGGLRRYREILTVLRRHGRRRVPAGALVYGVELVESALRDLLPNASGRSSAEIANAGGDRLASVRARINGRIHRANQTWHADGWASRRVHCLVRRNGGTLCVAGELPDSGPLRRQTLAVSAEGRELLRREIGMGPFELRMPAPPSGADGCLEVVVRASDVFVPERAGRGSDRRALAYRLHRVECEDAAG
jgi:glycosyltransferase involved in cell wall biosynthesis